MKTAMNKGKNSPSSSFNKNIKKKSEGKRVGKSKPSKANNQLNRRVK